MSLEAFMHIPSDKQPRDYQGAYRNLDVKFYAIPVFIIVALIGFFVSHPEASRWVSGAVQAEFSGSGQAAKPAGQVRTIKIN
jgi:hypothetical protein